MTEDKMKEVLFSLAWYDASNHHNKNVRKCLAYYVRDKREVPCYTLGGFVEYLIRDHQPPDGMEVDSE